MTSTESKYVEKKKYLSRYAHEHLVAQREAAARQAIGSDQEPKWVRAVQQDLSKYLPFLTKNCGLEFRGRILEIGAGGGWLSAELSKLPKVVEVIATDFSPTLLKDLAPRVFKLCNAHASKITRTPADFHELDFPDNYFDFVVCSEALREATNIIQVLREARRVLKSGGQFIAIREPVWPLVKIKSHAKIIQRLIATGVNERFYRPADYKEFFKMAGLPLEIKRVNTSSGFKYYFNAVVNGLTHARYAFIGTKRLKPAPKTAVPAPKRKGKAR